MTICYQIRLVIKSPFLFQGLEPAGADFDASAIRNAAGFPIIPASHIRGHFRHAFFALEVLAESKHADALFGDKSKEQTKNGEKQDQPNRGLLTFSDLEATGILEKEDTVTNLGRRGDSMTTRVEIDDATGAANPGSLQIIELVAKPGAKVVFEGTIRLLDENYQEVFEKRVKSALHLIPCLGAIKTAGFGELVAENSWIKKLPQEQAVQHKLEGDQFVIDASLDGPLLVNSEQISRNIFAGSTVISGGAIKGALADKLARIKPLDEAMNAALSAIRISHAFPVDKASGQLLDRAIPDSIVSFKGANKTSHYRDMSTTKSKDFSSATSAPAFPMDWKTQNFIEAGAALNRKASDLKRMPRGRVKIDQDGLAEDGNLFVNSAVDTTNVVWRFSVDTSGVSNKGAKSEILKELSSGLDRIGKLDTPLQVIKLAMTKFEDDELSKGAIRIILETPSLMTGYDDPAEIKEQYQRYFRIVLSDPALKLISAHARRGFAGGYQAIRFRTNQSCYAPFELTLAGAVFVLQSDAPDFVEAMIKLRRAGLPALVWKNGQSTRPDWEICPFVSENGFGEISVSSADHPLISDGNQSAGVV